MEGQIDENISDKGGIGSGKAGFIKNILSNGHPHKAIAVLFLREYVQFAFRPSFVHLASGEQANVPALEYGDGIAAPPSQSRNCSPIVV